MDVFNFFYYNFSEYTSVFDIYFKNNWISRPATKPLFVDYLIRNMVQLPGLLPRVYLLSIITVLRAIMLLSV